MTYHQFTQEERYAITGLRMCGASLAAIARTLGRHRSTVSRELRRNVTTHDGEYRAEKAHSYAVARRRRCRRRPQFSVEDLALVAQLLRKKWSAEQISGTLRRWGRLRISHETIYRRIRWDRRAGGDLWRHTRIMSKFGRKRYRSIDSRGVLPGKRSIAERPSEVARRQRIGDWEGDTVIGKNHQGALVTLVERKSRYTLAMRVDSKQSSPVTEAILTLMRPHKDQCLTITFDNGKEFAEHARIAKTLKAKVYFARPYHSWERGLNENTNGLLRQYFPKSTNLLSVSDCDVDEAVYQLNHRPRKCLGYRTPHEVFYDLDISPITLPSDALCT